MTDAVESASVMRPAADRHRNRWFAGDTTVAPIISVLARALRIFSFE